MATCYLEYSSDIKKRKIILILTLTINIGILALLKYTNLVINTINFFSKENQLPLVRWMAPIAISFYTLQIMSYLLDVYWGVTKVEKNPAKLLLFTCYFPLMISGPISRHKQLHVQFFETHKFDYSMLTKGFRRIAWGIAKKLVVANRLAVMVTYMFDNPDSYTGIWVFIAGFTFLIELYFDFSGCMDIIIGVSACFGIELQENFEAPMLSKTVQEIWQRWHITLGGWLKNYIMYPILKTDFMISFTQKCKKKLGKTGKKIPSFIAMFVVWTLIGLWHGNSWKYIVGEGWWFWIIIVMGQLLDPVFKKANRILHIKTEGILWKMIQVVRTWILFSIGLIFFRAASLQSALHMLKGLRISCGIYEPLRNLYVNTYESFGGKLSLIAIFLIILGQAFCEFRIYHKKEVQEIITNKPILIRWSMYLALIFIIIVTGDFGSSSFIYFGF